MTDEGPVSNARCSVDRHLELSLSEIENETRRIDSPGLNGNERAIPIPSAPSRVLAEVDFRSARRPMCYGPHDCAILVNSL